MSDLCDYLGDQLLDWLKGNNIDAAPADIYAALFDGDPDGAGVEVTGADGLDRQAISLGSIASREVANNADIEFGTATGGVDVDYIAIYDDATAGNLIAKKAITPAAITNGQEVKIVSGDLVFSY